MFIVPRGKIIKVLPWKDGPGWFVHLVEGYFYGLAVILFEEQAHIAEANWHSVDGLPIPAYVRVEVEHA